MYSAEEYRRCLKKISMMDEEGRKTALSTTNYPSDSYLMQEILSLVSGDQLIEAVRYYEHTMERDITWIPVEEAVPPNPDDIFYVTLFLDNNGDSCYQVHTGYYESLRKELTDEPEWGQWHLSDGYSYDFDAGEAYYEKAGRSRVVAWSLAPIDYRIRPYQPK